MRVGLRLALHLGVTVPWFSSLACATLVGTTSRDMVNLRNIYGLLVSSGYKLSVEGMNPRFCRLCLFAVFLLFRLPSFSGVPVSSISGVVSCVACVS